MQIPPNDKAILPVSTRRELRAKAEEARELACLQPWHTRRTSRVISVMFAEQACDELATRIIAAIDEQHPVLRVQGLLFELVQRELVGLANRPGTWCRWACSVLDALQLPQPVFGSAHLTVVRKVETPRPPKPRAPARCEACQWCGKLFETSKGRAKYCTTDCQLERQNAVRCELERAKRRASTLPRFCQQCEGEIPLHRHNSRFCSSACKSH